MRLLNPFTAHGFFGASLRTQALNLSFSPRLFLSLCFWGVFAATGFYACPRTETDYCSSARL